MQVYVDESGDLGWNFSQPFRLGGSSRYLCLAIMFVPKPDRKRPKHVISGMYRKYGWIEEMKASLAVESQELEFVNNATAMLAASDGIKIDCIVAKKENVQSHIRSDPNKLYNYMCKLVVCDYITAEPEIEFVPDKRSIKVQSGNSLSDYLQTVVWFECGCKTKIKNNPQESARNYSLQFVDWLAHIVWAHFENGETKAYSNLSPSIRIRKLFF